jgi:FHS family L-fucose permease-like MFS transporter
MAQNTSQEANAVVKLYVYFFATALALLAIGIGLSKLPKMESAEHHIGEQINDSIWKHPNLIFGAIGIFVYVGGEVAIGSSIANYLALDNIGGFISPSTISDAATRYRSALGEAAKYISLYWLGAMIGRFIGSALLQKIKPGKLLAFAAIMATLLVATSVLTGGHIAMWTILSVGLFNSIMFPCIFTMGIAELGPLTGDGSGLLNRGRSTYSLDRRQGRRSDQPSILSGDDPGRDKLGPGHSLRTHRRGCVLSLHFVFRAEWIETEQRAEHPIVN